MGVNDYVGGDYTRQISKTKRESTGYQNNPRQYNGENVIFVPLLAVQIISVMIRQNNVYGHHETDDITYNETRQAGMRRHLFYIYFHKYMF